VNGLKLLQRQQQANGTKGAYVFINERGQPFVASCAEWSRISVPIGAKVEHWCHSPSDPDWCQNSVNVGTAPWLVLSEPRPSADTRENQIGIDLDRFLSPSQQQAFVVVGQFLAAVNFRTLLDRNAPRPRPATLGAQMPPWAGCRAASKTEYESAKRDFLLQTSVGAYATTGHWWRRYYWYCHL